MLEAARHGATAHRVGLRSLNGHPKSQAWLTFPQVSSGAVWSPVPTERVPTMKKWFSEAHIVGWLRGEAKMELFADIEAFSSQAPSLGRRPHQPEAIGAIDGLARNGGKEALRA